MIGNISCGVSFGKETKYEMNKKKGQSAKYEPQKTEAEKTAAEDKASEIKASQIESEAVENSFQAKNKERAAGNGAAQKESLSPQKAGEKRKNVFSALQVPKENAPPYREGERHRILAANVAGETPRQIARHLKAVAEQNPKVSKPAVKISISASKNDKVTAEQWRKIGKGALKELGYQNSPFLIVQHRDREHDHIHILTSRIDVFGKTVNDSQSKLKLENFLRETEIKYNFEITQSSRKTLRAAPKRGELERFEEKGEVSIKMSLQTKIDYALGNKNSFSSPASHGKERAPHLKQKTPASKFISSLEKTKALALPRFDEKGNVAGVSFWLDGKIMKGSSLGRGFSWKKLQERGLDYQPERDNPFLLETKEKTEKIVAEWRENQARAIEQAREVKQARRAAQIEKPRQIIKKDIDKKNQFAAQKTTFFKADEIPVAENNLAESVKIKNLTADCSSVQADRFGEPHLEDKSNVLSTLAKPRVDITLKNSPENLETRITEIAPPNAEAQTQEKISQTNSSQTDLSFSKPAAEVIAGDNPAKDEPVADQLSNQLQKEKALSQSLLVAKPTQVELTSTANTFSENPLDIDPAAAGQCAVPDDSDSYSFPKPAPLDNYDDSNKRFWEEEQERINNQIAERQKEFAQSLSEYFQQITENQSQTISQAQQQTSLQTQSDALDSLNEIMFGTNGGNTQIYQNLNQESSSGAASKPLTIESFNTPYNEKDLHLTDKPDVAEISNAAEIHDIKEISNNHVSQLEEIDSDSGGYWEDWEDEFDRDFGQAMSLF